MDLKVNLLNILRNELDEESALVLERNIRKRPIISADVDNSAYSETEFHISEYSELLRENKKCCNPPKRSYRRIKILILIVICVIGVLLITGIPSRDLSPPESFPEQVFIYDLFLPFPIVFITLIIAVLSIYFVIKLVKYVYSIFDNKFNSIQPRNIEVKSDFDDNVYFIISSTYETLDIFRKERERQAKISFNVALSLIIAGVLVVFGGVFLLFRKDIVEGVLSSSVGCISSIIGGTIINLYNNTNDRMDKLNANLSTLNYVKVQYALILKINDEKKRNIELSKLIKSIGKIET